MGFKMTGFRNLDRHLRTMEKAAQLGVAIEALTAGGEVIAEEMRRLVPVRTGRLRDSIAVSTDGGGGFGIRLTQSSFAVNVGPAGDDGYHGHLVEFGTVHSAAHPFIRPAFDTQRDAAFAAVRAVVSSKIR